MGGGRRVAARGQHKIITWCWCLFHVSQASSHKAVAPAALHPLGGVLEGTCSWHGMVSRQQLTPQGHAAQCAMS